MAFDPNIPEPNAELTSAMFRTQLQGLKALIDAIPAGPEGPPGPPFANAVVDSVATVDPGQPAVVTVTFDGTNVRFSFSIPRGAAGTTGPQGNDGAQGVPGEVTAAQLSGAIAGTSNVTNSVATLDTAFADADLETVRQKLNELILAARR
ncbi:MAG: hypothetical protein JNJ83_11410 [Verrucomicrobiaceae bacterium]|nr:hypothetical protein [Verrucomicrobiaceae bacterium]